MFPVVSSRVRELRLMTRLRLTQKTLLVPLTADRWRVTTKSACFPSRRRRLVRNVLLACALTPSAVLLRTRTCGLVSSMCVKVTSRCRLVDRADLCLLIIALHLLGSLTTNLRVRMVPVVVLTLLLAVLSPLQWTPLCMPLEKTKALRSTMFTRWCSDVSAMLCMLRLLTAIEFLDMLQKCDSRPTTAAPLVFAGLISVTACFGLMRKLMRPRTPWLLPLQWNIMLPKLMCLWTRGRLVVLGPPWTLGAMLSALKTCLRHVE